MLDVHRYLTTILSPYLFLDIQQHWWLCAWKFSSSTTLSSGLTCFVLCVIWLLPCVNCWQTSDGTDEVLLWSYFEEKQEYSWKTPTRSTHLMYQFQGSNPGCSAEGTRALTTESVVQLFLSWICGLSFLCSQMNFLVNPIGLCEAKWECVSMRVCVYLCCQQVRSAFASNCPL